MKLTKKRKKRIGIIFGIILLSGILIFVVSQVLPLSIFGYGGYPDPTIQKITEDSNSITYKLTFKVTPSKIQEGVTSDNDLGFSYSSNWVNPNEYAYPGEETADPRSDIQFIKYKVSDMKVSSSIIGLNGWGTSKVTECTNCPISVTDFGSYCTPKVGIFYYQQTPSYSPLNKRLSFDCQIAGEFATSPPSSAYKVDSSATLSFNVVVLKQGVQCTSNQDISCGTGKECVNNQCMEQTRTYYRFSNNQCSSVLISSTQKTANDYDTSAECQAKIINPPTVLPSKGFLYWLQQLNQWITDFFKRILGLTITGLENVEPNTIQTYQIDISTTTPDSDYSDGSYSVQWANWVLVDSLGNIKQQGTWERVYGRFQKEVTITTPSNIGDYMLLGIITQYDMTYNFPSKVWTTSEERVMNKEGINLKNKYVVIAPTTPQPSGFAKFLSSIINFFKNLFGIK